MQTTDKPGGYASWDCRGKPSSLCGTGKFPPIMNAMYKLIALFTLGERKEIGEVRGLETCCCVMVKLSVMYTNLIKKLSLPLCTL
jgi:hypothetical protein